MTDSRNISENNPPILIGTHIYIESITYKYLITNICLVVGANIIKSVKSGRKELLFQLPEQNIPIITQIFFMLYTTYTLSSLIM